MDAEDYLLLPDCDTLLGLLAANLGMRTVCLSLLAAVDGGAVTVAAGSDALKTQQHHFQLVTGDEETY